MRFKSGSENESLFLLYGIYYKTAFIMEYNKTGQFTDEQRSICKKIRKLINDGKKKSLIFKLKDNQINAYLDKELKNAANEKDVDSIDYNHPLKRLNCGTISTHFQDDEPCFKIGFIDEKIDI